MAQFVDSFNSEYHTAVEGMSALPKPMNEAWIMTNEIVKNLYSNYNISGNNKNLMQFCRTSVEKYIFGKIYSRLFEMYQLKYQEEDKLFQERSITTMTTDPVSMLKHLGVNKKFIIWDRFKFSNSESKYEFKNKLPEGSENSSNISESESASDYSTPRQEPKNWDDNLIPYHESIKALERISSYTSPREKLDWIIDFFSNMKASIVDFWKGKVELTTMDDILPLCIYWVWYCNSQNFVSEINLIKDFINIAGDEATDSLERTLVNIEMGIQYVSTTDEFPFDTS